MGEGYRATGMPKTFNGYARTTEATIANIRPNAFQPNSSRLELDGKLFNRYEYQLMAPKIPEWQRDLPGYLVVIEFYSTPSVRVTANLLLSDSSYSRLTIRFAFIFLPGSRLAVDQRAVLAIEAHIVYSYLMHPFAWSMLVM